ncbi:MAG: response regulator transcription factor [Candidatus Hydrothermarchaeaceae archaeon]
MAKIMIVDDEKDILTLVGEMLRREGYAIVECSSGVECLEKVEKEKPDLILMDIMMPDPDGFTVAKKLKEGKATKNIPIAMLTVKSSRDDKIKSFRDFKCDGYITKPVNRSELLKVVEWMLEGK